MRLVRPREEEDEPSKESEEGGKPGNAVSQKSKGR